MSGIHKYYGYKSHQGHQLKFNMVYLQKNITVPTDRLQGVLEHQSYIRKLFGYTSIHFISQVILMPLLVNRVMIMDAS